MDPDDIKGEKTLQAWLNGQTNKDAFAISLRSALRVAPIWIVAIAEPWASERDLAYLPILRTLAIWAIPTARASVQDMASAADAFLAADNASRAAAKNAKAKGDLAAAAFLEFAVYAAAAADFTRRRISDPNNNYLSSAAVHASRAAERYARNNPYFFDQIREDARRLQHGDDLSNLPLWSIPLPDWFKRVDAEVRAIWAREPAVWSFWARWWDGVLSGQPINWDLQRDVALIPEDEWKKGPPHIAKLIARLEEQFDLRAQIAELRANLQALEARVTAQIASEAHRSHNHPPELVDAPAAIRQEVAVVFAALDDAETELAKSEPDPSILRRAGLAIIRAAKAIARYCAGLGGIVLKKAAEELGSTGTKWAIKTFAALYAAQSEPMLDVGRAIVKFARELFGG